MIRQKNEIRSNNRITPEKLTALAPSEIRVTYRTTGGLNIGVENQECKIWVKRQGNGVYGLGILRFVKFAQANEHLTFYVTPLEGYDDAHIAAWFRNAVGLPNVYLPQRYWDGIEYAYKHYHFK